MFSLVVVLAREMARWPGVAEGACALDACWLIRWCLHLPLQPTKLNSDGVRSAFHQFPGAGHCSLLVRFYGVLVGSSPTLPSEEVMLILTAYRLFGLRKGGDMLGRSLWPAWRGPKRTVLVYFNYSFDWFSGCSRIPLIRCSGTPD